MYMATFFAFLGIFFLILLIKFIYDTYVTDNTENDWKEFKKTNPNEAAQIKANKGLDLRTNKTREKQMSVSTSKKIKDEERFEKEIERKPWTDFIEQTPRLDKVTTDASFAASQELDDGKMDIIKAIEYRNSGDNTMSIRHYNIAIAKGSTQTFIYHNRALIYMDTGDYESATKDALQYMQEEPLEAKAYILVLFILIKRKEYNSAEKIWSLYEESATTYLEFNQTNEEFYELLKYRSDLDSFQRG